MKKYYVTQSCKKFTPILNIFYKNLKLLDFFDGLVVYTDDNKFSPSDSFIKVIHGKDISYSDNLKIAVNSCSEDCFFCGCDDYIFYKDHFKVKEISKIWDYFCNTQDIGILRLNKAKCELKTFNKELSILEVPKSYKYSVNLQPCMWKKIFFNSINQRKLNAWDFEHRLTSVAKKSKYICCCTETNLSPLINGNKNGDAYRCDFVDLVESIDPSFDFSKSTIYVKRNGTKKNMSYNEYIKNGRFLL